MKYVVPGAPQDSYLMRKIESANPGCGLTCMSPGTPGGCKTRMPSGSRRSAPRGPGDDDSRLDQVGRQLVASPAEAHRVIGRLTGTVAAEGADETFVLDVRGVGYELIGPSATVGRARGHGRASELTFYVHTHVREDALSLFAFATPEDKSRAFER